MTASTAHRHPHAPALAAGDLLDTATAAELLACSTRTVTNLIQRGHLPALRLGAGRTAYRIHAHALHDFAARYGHHDPRDVADTLTPDQLDEPTPAPLELVAHHDPGGLLLVTPYRPPDGMEQG